MMMVLPAFFGNLPAAQACEEGSRTGPGKFFPVVVGKDAPRVSWTIAPDTIAVYAADAPCRLLQAIPYDAAMLPELSDSERVIAEDMNFDGYTDLKIMAGRGNANVYYNCWLWDQKRQKFILHAELSKLASPQFDSGAKTILSFTHISAADSVEATYTFQNGKLRPVQIMEQAYDRKENVIVARQYRVDEKGKRHLVREQVVRQEQEAAVDESP